MKLMKPASGASLNNREVRLLKSKMPRRFKTSAPLKVNGRKPTRRLPKTGTALLATAMKRLG